MDRLKIVLLLLALTTLSAGISSCEKDEEIPFAKDSEGAITSMPYQWRTSLTTDGSLISGFVSTSVIHGENVLFSAQGVGKDGNELLMLSSTSGKIIWVWKDFVDAQKRFVDIRNLHQHNNQLIFQERKNFYQLDLSTGATVRKETRDYHATRMDGLEEKYFTAGAFVPGVDGLYEGSIFVGDIVSNKIEKILTPEYNRNNPNVNNEVGIVGSVKPLKGKFGDILLSYDYSSSEENGVNTYAGLINLSTQQNLYSEKVLALGTDSYGSSIPVIYEDKVYFAPERTIVCLDLYTGEPVWRKEFTQGFTFSGFTIAENKVIANNEDTFLYALDPNTGQQIWKEQSSGTSSRMTYQDGVIYFTGGGDGLLHAVETATGKHLWRLASPDLSVNSGAWFKDVVRVIPSRAGKKGQVLVSSYLSAFCYEAAR